MKLTTITLLAAAAITSPLATTAPDRNSASNGGLAPCEEVASLAYEAERTLALGALQLALAQAVHASHPAARQRLEDAAAKTFDEELERTGARRDARRALCLRTGGQILAPPIDPFTFSDVIDSPYFNLPAGRVLRYVRTGGGETESITVASTNETIMIMGVSCRVVRDVVRVEGEVEEVTEEYFARDTDGNVWIFGERTAGAALGDGISQRSGSWLAGIRGAQPGIVVRAEPLVGETLRSGFLLGVVEEASTTVALGTTIHVEYGTFHGCLEIVTQSPLDPTEVELKTLAPGIGLVNETNLGTGERLQLVEIIR